MKWIKRLPAVLKAMTSEYVKITLKESIEIRQYEPSYKHRTVRLVEVWLPPDVKVIYLSYAPGEDEGGEKGRATDPIWNLEIYDLSRSVVSAEQPVLYYLSEDVSQRGFAREELQVIPEDTELPPNSVLKWLRLKVWIPSSWITVKTRV